MFGLGKAEAGSHPKRTFLTLFQRIIADMAFPFPKNVVQYAGSIILARTVGVPVGRLAMTLVATINN